MTALSPFDAATEGFRVIRREPRAVLVWGALWLAALSVTALVVASGERVTPGRLGIRRDLDQIIGQFGPFAILLIALLLLAWATTTVATFRAVLRPYGRAWFYLRLGADEFRLAVMTVSAVILVLFLGGAPAFVLLLLVSPLMEAAHAFARDIATAGAAATVCLDIWIAVRLSLIAVETFAERRFHLTAYWPLAAGRFWYLLASYLICFVLFFILLLGFAASGVLLETLQNAIGFPHGADPFRRLGLLALAGGFAVLTAAFFVLTTVLVCGCQAHAYRAITVDRPAEPTKTASGAGEGLPTRLAHESVADAAEGA
jgi:hypothetical protein